MRWSALRARPRWQLLLAALVVLALVAVGAFTVLRLTANRGSGPVNRVDRASARVTPDGDTHVGIPGMVDLYVPKGAVSSPTDARVTLGGEDPLGVLPLTSKQLLFETPPIQIDLSGRQPLVPLTVTITVPPGSAVRWPVLVTKHAGELKYVAGQYDTASRRFSARLAQLSPIALVDVYQAAMKLMTGVLDVTGVRGKKPDCAGKPATLIDASTVTVTNLTGTDTLWPCVSATGDQVRVDVHSVAGTFWRVTSSGGTYQGAAAVSGPDLVTQALFETLTANPKLGEGLILPQGAGSWLADPKAFPLTMTAKLSAGFWFAQATAFVIVWLAEVGSGGQGGALLDLAKKLHEALDAGSPLECLSKAADAAKDGLTPTSELIIGVMKAALACADDLVKAVTGAELKGLAALLVTIFASGIATIWGALEVSLRKVLSILRPSLTQFSWRVVRDPGPVIIGSDHIGPFILGMSVDQVHNAAGVTLDHDDRCGFYTFHAEQSFGRGDGPTFFFDDTAHLRGMLLGRSVFHRAVRTDRGARIGTTLAGLQDGYGAALIPPGHADSPDLAWVKGASGNAIGFEMDVDGRIAGFRVGVEPFVTALEFCA